MARLGRARNVCSQIPSEERVNSTELSEFGTLPQHVALVDLMTGSAFYSTPVLKVGIQN